MASENSGPGFRGLLVYDITGLLKSSCLPAPGLALPVVRCCRENVAGILELRIKLVLKKKDQLQKRTAEAHGLRSFVLEAVRGGCFLVN